MLDNAFLNNLTMGTAFPRVPLRNDLCLEVCSTSQATIIITLVRQID